MDPKGTQLLQKKRDLISNDSLAGKDLMTQVADVDAIITRTNPATLKKGIYRAGGIPFKFNIISIYDGIILAHNDMRFVLQNRGRSPPLECQAQMISSLH